MGIVKREGQVERTEEHRVVGGIDGKGLEGDGLKGVGVLSVCGGEEDREEQRARIVRWTNRKRGLVWKKILVRRTNGERRMVWELRSEGG